MMGHTDMSLCGPQLLVLRIIAGTAHLQFLTIIVGSFILTTKERLDSDLTDGHDDTMDCVHEP